MGKKKGWKKLLRLQLQQQQQQQPAQENQPWDDQQASRPQKRLRQISGRPQDPSLSYQPDDHAANGAYAPPWSSYRGPPYYSPAFGAHLPPPWPPANGTQAPVGAKPRVRSNVWIRPLQAPATVSGPDMKGQGQLASNAGAANARGGHNKCTAPGLASAASSGRATSKKVPRVVDEAGLVATLETFIPDLGVIDTVVVDVTLAGHCTCGGVGAWKGEGGRASNGSGNAGAGGMSSASSHAGMSPSRLSLITLATRDATVVIDVGAIGFAAVHRHLHAALLCYSEAAIRLLVHDAYRLAPILGAPSSLAATTARGDALRGPPPTRDAASHGDGLNGDGSRAGHGRSSYADWLAAFFVLDTQLVLEWRMEKERADASIGSGTSSNPHGRCFHRLCDALAAFGAVPVCQQLATSGTAPSSIVAPKGGLCHACGLPFAPPGSHAVHASQHGTRAGSSAAGHGVGGQLDDAQVLAVADRAESLLARNATLYDEILGVHFYTLEMASARRCAWLMDGASAPSCAGLLGLSESQPSADAWGSIVWHAPRRVWFAPPEAGATMASSELLQEMGLPYQGHPVKVQSDLQSLLRLVPARLRGRGSLLAHGGDRLVNLVDVTLDKGREAVAYLVEAGGGRVQVPLLGSAGGAAASGPQGPQGLSHDAAGGEGAGGVERSLHHARGGEDGHLPDAPRGEHGGESGDGGNNANGNHSMREAEGGVHGHHGAPGQDGLVTTSDLLTLKQSLEACGSGFGSDNRAGIDGQLHRISAIRNKQGEIIGVTMRVGRAMQGIAELLRDVLYGKERKSVLVLGVPGAGKTTMVRDIARVLSTSGDTVLIVDTSNEIGGDGDVPHAAIGSARRMMVPSLSEQGSVMVQCLQNHTPGTMVVDEIGRAAEVAAAQTVKQRGVRLVASAHGDLRSLVKNQELRGLVGGVATVTVGDDRAAMAEKRKGLSGPGSKLVQERAGVPTFDVVVEVSATRRLACRVVLDVAAAVDAILRGERVPAQVRQLDGATGALFVRQVAM